MTTHALDLARSSLAVRLDGVQRQVPLSPLSSDVLRRLEPIRDTTARRSSTPQIAALFYSLTMLDLVPTESMAEQSRVLIADFDRKVQPPVLDPELVEMPQSATREIAELGVVALRLELRDHHDRQDDRVLREAEQGLRVAEQHRCVEHICAKSRVIV